MEKFSFLIPVFNDWNSLNILLKQIDQEILSFKDRFDVVILNDNSTIKHSIKNQNFKKINLSWVIFATPQMRSHLCSLFGAPYKIRTCDPRFRNARDSQYTSHRVKYKRSQTLRRCLIDYKLVLPINQGSPGRTSERTC